MQYMNGFGIKLFNMTDILFFINDLLPHLYLLSNQAKSTMMLLIAIIFSSSLVEH
jgi:hypothetical protein